MLDMGTIIDMDRGLSRLAFGASVRAMCGTNATLDVTSQVLQIAYSFLVPICSRIKPVAPRDVWTHSTQCRSNIMTQTIVYTKDSSDGPSIIFASSYRVL